MVLRRLTDAASARRLDRITAGNSATLEFQAISNKTYTVQHTDRVGGGLWPKLADVVARANNPTETILDSAPAANRNYRLVTPRQP